MGCFVDFAHPHYFTKETALRTLTNVGYKLWTTSMPPNAIEVGELFVQKIGRLPNELCALSQDLTIRNMGGYSFKVLAQ
jgi:hypothetical protein